MNFKRNFKHVIGVAVLTLLASCDCNQNVSGRVLDSETNMPLDRVYIHKENKDYGKFTSTSGDFLLDAIDGGLFGCPVMTVVLEKSGYVTKTETIENSGHKAIKLTRNKGR